MPLAYWLARAARARRRCTSFWESLDGNASEVRCCLRQGHRGPHRTAFGTQW